jgi:hypothetical protein
MLKTIFKTLLMGFITKKMGGRSHSGPYGGGYRRPGGGLKGAAVSAIVRELGRRFGGRR